MERILLSGKKREIFGKKSKTLRKAGFLPGIVYGHGFKNLAIQVAKEEFLKVYRQAGSSSLINLSIDGHRPITVLIHDVFKHPAKDEVLHVDFYRVRMDEEIRTEIPLKLVGEAPAVTELEGTLVQNHDTLEVEALPSALVPEIEVDVSSLKTFEDQIRVADLKLPEGIKVLYDPEEVLVFVTPPRSKEELEALETVTPAKEEAELVEELNRQEEAQSSAEETKDEDKKEDS